MCEVPPVVFQDLPEIFFQPFDVIPVDFIDHLLGAMPHEPHQPVRIDAQGQGPGGEGVAHGVGDFVADLARLAGLLPDVFAEVGRVEIAARRRRDQFFAGAARQEEVEALPDRLGDRDLANPVGRLGGVVLLPPDDGMLHLDVIGLDVAARMLDRQTKSVKQKL